jgi:hypothetical protein
MFISVMAVMVLFARQNLPQSPLHKGIFSCSYQCYIVYGWLHFNGRNYMSKGDQKQCMLSSNNQTRANGKTYITSMDIGVPETSVSFAGYF